jgi:O-antigen/teichoic acid export membrane protein
MSAHGCCAVAVAARIARYSDSLDRWMRSSSMSVRSTDFINLASLTCIQVSNALMPLLVFPYALGVVGAVAYSKIAVSEAISLMALSLVIFSFEVDGVARIAGMCAERDAAHISRVFSGILYFRLLIFVLCMCALALASPLLTRDQLVLLLCWMLVPLGYALQSNWLFQGLERNAPLALIVVGYRTFTLLFIFATIKTPSDYRLVPAYIGGFALAGALAALFYIVVGLGIRLRIVPVRELAAIFLSGKEIFLGNLSVMLYRDINVILLRVVGLPDVAIAGYSLAEKVIKCAQATMRPINQLFFPKVLSLVRNMSGPNSDALRQILRLTYPQQLILGAGVVVGTGIYFAVVGRIERLQHFPSKELIETLVSIMIFSIFFGNANFMLGTAGLNGLNDRLYYLKAICLTGLVSVVTCLVLGAAIGAVGAAISFLLAEALLFFLVSRRYRRNNQIRS